MITYKDIAGAVILYNSPVDVLDNINTYLNQIEKLYVIDNSTEPNKELVKVFQSKEGIVYTTLNGNKGVAAALNHAAKQAIQDGFTLLLTMDDDTRTPANMVSQMLAFWNNYTHSLGILSGVHHDKPDIIDHRSVLYTLTSGNLLNLAAYQSIGDFRDDFFIDHVDHDYCIRLNNAGYHVVELPSIHLDHKLGYAEQIKLGSRIVYTYGTNTPIRLYYYARNGIYVARKYFRQHPEFSWMLTKELVRRWVKTLILDKNRSQRVKMMMQGFKDGLNRHLGKYEPHS